MGRGLKAQDWAAGIVLALCILTFAVVLVLNWGWLYKRDMKAYSLSETSGYTDEQIWENYRALIDYNNLGGDSGRISFPSMPVSVTAAIHFEEVRNIFIVTEVLFLISLPLSIFFILWQRKRRRRTYLAITSALTGPLPIALGLLVAANWERFFIAFHELVFRNDYWLFDPDEDPIIRILPDGYFMHCAITILSIWLTGSLLCLLFWRRGRQKDRL